MTEKTSKIKTWSLHSTFVQANLINGFRYLDLSGKVLNRIRNEYLELQFVAPVGTGLFLPKKVGEPYAIRFGADRIWLQYAPIESLDHVVANAPPIIRTIAEDIEVTQFDRLGMRAVYFVPCDDLLEATSSLKLNVVGGAFTSFLTKDPRKEARFQAIVPFSFKEHEIIIRLQGIDIVRPARQPGDYPSQGLLFDVDVGHKAKEGVPIRRSETTEIAKAMSETARTMLFEVGHKLLEGIKL